MEKETQTNNETLIIAPEQKQTDFLLPASIIIAAVLISGSIFYLVGSQRNSANTGGNNGAPAANQQANVAAALAAISKTTDRDVILGDTNAPVTIIEYADFQCPFCTRFFKQTELLIRDAYVQTNKVRMVYRNFQFLGAESIAAGAAAECAKDQRQFWAYHDALYNAEAADEQANPSGSENSGNLNRTLFLKLASDLKLDTAAFTNCIDSKKYDAQVQQDATDAQQFGVNSTPTFYINGQLVSGAQPFDAPGNTNPQVTPFKPIIENFLRK
jgi:protein-disulfide isomerase